MNSDRKLRRDYLKINRVISVAIVAAMISVSFAVGISINAQAEFIETNVGVGWMPGEFIPMDVAWNDAGTVCVVVGQFVAGPIANVWVYDHFEDTWTPYNTGGFTTPSNMNGVCYDDMKDIFWIGGNWVATEPSSIYYYDPVGKSIGYPIGKDGSDVLTKDLNSIACDNWGNPLGVGVYGTSSNMYYFDVSLFENEKWFELATLDVMPEALNSVDFNTNDGRFYVGGQYSSQCMFWYTDSTGGGVLTSVSQAYADGSSFYRTGQFHSIAWNQAHDYALVAGDAGLYKMGSVVITNSTGFMDWTIINDDGTYNFFDVAWDTDGWNEAAIVGQRITPTDAMYWRYYNSNRVLIEGHNGGGSDVYNCVSVKPPASPKFVFIPASNGGIVAKIMANDQSTRITANAVFPKLYWIGFNDTGGGASRMDQQVPVDAWYDFTLQANYSQGWAGVEVEVTAWYDWGLAGTNSVYPAETDGNRDLAFRLLWTESTGSYTVEYPTGNLEVNPGVVTDTDQLDNIPSPTESTHIVQMPIYLGAQIRNANGNGFGIGDPDFDTDKNVALLDIWSWDFNVTIRDEASTSAMNYSHGEFGIDETVSVLVSGNPAGNAPPGSGLTALANPSIITYSTNTDYWVNVSIPHLYENGIDLAPNRIDCDDVYVQNMCVNASTPANSDLEFQVPMPIVPKTDVYVWGQDFTPIAAPSNGTTAAGPYITNFNAPIWLLNDYTQLDWAVDVQAGTAEGIYWGIITITIDS